MLVNRGVYKALYGKKNRPSKIDDDKWNDTDFCVNATIVLYLSDEILYNVMNEETIAGLCCKFKSMSITKSLSNKHVMKKQLYDPRMKEGTHILQLNTFNRIVCDFIALEVKLQKEDKALLLYSLPPSYDNL